MNGPTFAHTTTSKPAPAAAPRPAGPARPAARPDADAGNGMRVLTYLRLHWLMILFCGTLLGSVGAYAAWELMPSKYESYALLQVSSAPFTIGNQSKEQAKTDFVTYLKTTARLIKSEFVLSAALRDGRLQNLETIRGQKEPIKFLEEELQVEADGTEVIRITFKGHNPTDVKQVVDEVKKAFMKEVVEKDVQQRQADWAKVQDAMVEMRKVLENQIQPKAGRTAANMIPAGGPGAPGPLPQLTPNGPAAQDAPQAPAVDADEFIGRLKPDYILSKYTGLKADLDRLPGLIAEQRQKLEALKTKLVELQKSPPDPASYAAADRDEDVAVAKFRLIKAKRNHDDKVTFAGKIDAPVVIDARRDLAAAEAEWKKLREEKAKVIDGARQMELAKKIRDEGSEIEQRLNNLRDQEKDGKARLAKTQELMFKLPLTADKPGGELRLAGHLEAEYDPRKTALNMEDMIFARLVSQYHLTNLDMKSPARVRELQAASQPTQRDIRKQILGTVFAGLMGYALIALGVVAFETVGKRVSSLADLKSSAPATVIGVIPCQPHEATGRDPVKRAAANEAIDKLRAHVAQTWLARGATTVAVTSPLGDEGKAFTAFGLASSLAQAGYRTLLVDFDLREPALHAYAGVPNLNGICEVLRGEADVRGAFLALPSGLHMVVAGKWSDEARKAAVGGKLESLLARLKEPYDCVVIHAHALLTVAETVEVARRCEAVILSAQYRQTKMPLVKLAADRLTSMEVAHAGVVYVGATEQEALC